MTASWSSCSCSNSSSSSSPSRTTEEATEVARAAGREMSASVSTGRLAPIDAGETILSIREAAAVRARYPPTASHHSSSTEASASTARTAASEVKKMRSEMSPAMAACRLETIDSILFEAFGASAASARVIRPSAVRPAEKRAPMP